ncbi:hypothetical protein GGS20DRAFT_395421 [Poronia punctata]|nr:hypothetical protein GGS20DRAFT_395421 [Poronia punctata]
MSKFDYNLFQQMYCLSMVSGIVSGVQGPEQDLQKIMKDTLKAKLQNLPGNWKITFGPRVFKWRNKCTNVGGPDNVWFAAVDDQKNVCVSIAGTQDNSIADIFQDLAVWEVVDFNNWVGKCSPYSDGIPEPQSTKPQDSDPSTAFCSAGTCVGVWNVLSNVEDTSVGERRLDQYLRSLDDSHNIVIAGHSLGGALAPVTALALCTAEQPPPASVKVLGSAGVSPGNAALMQQYAAKFPKTPASTTSYEVYNADFFNKYDIVPQAWSLDPSQDRNLDNILKKILTFTFPYNLIADGIVSLAKELPKPSGIDYVPLPGQEFEGTKPPDNITFEQLKDIFGCTHVLDYWTEIGITEFMELFKKDLKSKLPQGGSELAA